MKKIIIFLNLILFFFLPVANSKAEIAENLSEQEQGIVLYMEAGSALAQKDFSLAKVKYEKAAQYLSGEIQEQAVRMADFIGKMNSEIKSKTLLKDNSDFEIIGEVQEEGKIWHLYYSSSGLSLMHVALAGEKDLDKIIETVGTDLFNRQLVTKDAYGYLSKELSSLPEVSSKIRMWYCQQNNTTNIIYENYSGSADAIQRKSTIVDGAFKEVECRRSQFNYTLLLIIIGLIVIAILLVWHFKFRKKISKKSSLKF